MKKTKIFVTGATGFVGSWLVKRLVEEGFEVGSLVRSPSKINPKIPFFQYLDKIHLYPGDLTNQIEVKKAIGSYQPESVIHLAAELTSNDFEKMFRTNVEGTLNVLHSSYESGTKRFLGGSTFKTYSGEEPPYTEENWTLGYGSAYSFTKSLSDLCILNYSDRMTTKVVRCPNIFGGADFDFNGIVQENIRNAILKGEIEIRGDGKGKRDYLYVEDVVEAYLFLLHGDKDSGEIFNIGSGEPISTLEICERIQKGMNPKPRIKVLGLSEDDDQYMSTEKVKRKGYTPRIGIQEGLRKTIEWQRKNIE